jgi:glycosyltransferase involved in cell wall biosynthesis
MRIGYASQQYPEIRNIIKKVDGCDYYLCRDAYSVIRKILSIFKIPINPEVAHDIEFCFNDFNLNKVDLIHFFNNINFSNTPWIVTFETLAPRFKSMLDRGYLNADMNKIDRKILRAMDALASKNCIALIALSKCNAEMQRTALQAFPNHYDAISKKITIIHPPQGVLLNTEFTPQKALANTLTVMLVGHHFFRKGGREVVNAISKLRNTENAEIRLIIVSKIHADSYASGTTQFDEIAAKESLKKHASWIEWHEAAPHSEVINLMHRCDIGLLPSYAETYGYSVLEFQACGVPVITTNIRAFPEINNHECGWLIDIPKHPSGEAQYENTVQRHAISKAIEEGVINILRGALIEPEETKRKGRKALVRIREEHCPERFANKLSEIYSSAF